MPEPPTHYQLSFTVRQAMVLFIGLLVCLGGAYFLGLMTGLAGHESSKIVAAVPPEATPEPTVRPRNAAPASPTAISPARTRVAPIPAFPRPVLGKEPTNAPHIQFFEDQPEAEPTAVPARTPSPAGAAPGKAASPPVAPARPRASASSAAVTGEFWIQVTSVISEREARTRRDRLIHRGYRARVQVGEGPKGKIYRVRVGPYTSRDEAARVSERLSREEKGKTWIVPAGQ